MIKTIKMELLYVQRAFNLFTILTITKKMDYTGIDSAFTKKIKFFLCT